MYCPICVPHSLPIIEEGDIFKTIIQYEDKDKHELGHELYIDTAYEQILNYLQTQALSKKEIATKFGQIKVSGHLNRTISKLLADDLIEHTMMDNPNHPSQQFKLTEKGKQVVAKIVIEVSMRQALGQSSGQSLGQSSGQSSGQDSKEYLFYYGIVKLLHTQPLSRKELAALLGQAKVSGHLNRTISKLLADELIEHTIVNNPNHPSQKFKLTENGIAYSNTLIEKQK